MGGPSREPPQGRAGRLPCRPPRVSPPPPALGGFRSAAGAGLEGGARNATASSSRGTAGPKRQTVLASLWSPSGAVPLPCSSGRPGSASPAPRPGRSRRRGSGRIQGVQAVAAEGPGSPASAGVGVRWEGKRLRETNWFPPGPGSPLLPRATHFSFPLRPRLGGFRFVPFRSGSGSGGGPGEELRVG